MKRKCAIEGCKAELENKKQNRRQLFKFPSDEEMKNKWLRSIGHNLKEGRSHLKNLYICNIHFEESCFHDSVLKIMKDGCEVTLSRKLFKLKKHSIPSIFKDDAQNPTGTLTPSNNREADSHFSASSCGKSNVLQREEACSSTSAGSLSTGKNKRYEKINLSPTSKRRVDNVNQVMSLPYSDPVNKSTVVTPSECIPNEKYTNAALIKDWNERDAAQFPDHWGMFNDTSGVLFVYIGDVEDIATRSIFVNNDMTVEIRAHNHVAKFPLLKEVSSLEDVRKAMIELVCLSICERAWKGQCKNGFFIPKRVSISKKCRDCQVIATREKHREHQTARRLLMKSKNKRIKRKTLKKD